MNKQRIKASKVFYYLHKIIKDDYSFAEDKVTHYISKKNRNFFMNEYYNMNVEQIVWYVSNCKNLKEVHKELLNDYKKCYADAWFENIVYVLGQ